MGRRTTGYANEEIPDSMPPANQGAIPVLVRLVDGKARRAFPARRGPPLDRDARHGRPLPHDPDTGRRKDQLAWLRAEDVYRVLRPEDVKRR